MRDRAVRMLMIGTILAVSASHAHAQGTTGAFKGYLTGHVGAITAGDVTNERLTVGASVAVHDGTGWGAELDLGHTADVTSGRQRLDVTTYLVNAAWVRPGGLVRPFGLAGAGVMQINGCDAPCNVPARTYDLGANIGGGAFVAVQDALAFRADARYFFSTADHRDLQRPDNFSFWRISAGVSYLWNPAP